MNSDPRGLPYHVTGTLNGLPPSSGCTLLDKKGSTGDLVKKIEKKKEIKMSGQSKIEVNPKADIGQYAGGTRVNTGNLH